MKPWVGFIFIVSCLPFSAHAEHASLPGRPLLDAFITVTQVDYKNSGARSGAALGGTIVFAIPSISVELVAAEDTIGNLFMGYGLGSLFQYQIGYGTKGKVVRMTSDIPIPKTSFLISFSASEYNDEEVGDVRSIGIGMSQNF